MKKRILIGALIVIVGIGLVFTMSSCDALFAALFSVEGSIVDARDTDLAGVADVSITLTGVSADKESGDEYSFTATTNSNGTFTITDVNAGTYTLTAEKDGWFIPPKTVSISGMISTIDALPAFKLKPADLYGLSFIVTWNADVDDVDIHLSTPEEGTTGTPNDLITPYTDTLDQASRERIYYARKKYEDVIGSTVTVAYMDRDDLDGSGPETMNLLRVTGGGDGSAETVASSVENDENGMYTAFKDLDPAISDPDFFGSAVLYLNAYTSDANLSSGTSGAAEAQVYVIQTLPKEASEAGDIKNNPTNYSETDLTYDYLGFYKVPEFTTIKSASVLRVNMFVEDTGGELFQIVPDLRVIPQGPEETYAEVSGWPSFKAINNMEPIGVRGSTR